VKDAEGAAAYLEINRDLTDRRRNEEALRNAQKLETVGQLAGGIAHDFNNLLTAIIGHASALEHLRSAQDRMSVAAILEAGGRAAELTRQLLAYSGKGQFVIDGVDLSAVVRDVYDLLRAAVPASAVLHLELASGLPPISADPGQMQQLVVNLVTNAGEALVDDRSGSVRVRTYASKLDSEATVRFLPEYRLARGYHVCLEVSDNGSGIEVTNLPKIFDPFFTTRFFGRGLGLAAVQGIVRSFRGAIEVESDRGRGSTFRIWIPSAQT
jgi:signal transduction histidine kinase